MAEDTPETPPIPAATPDSDGAVAAELVDGLQATPATATEDAIEAFGADVYQRVRSAFARGDIMLALGVVAILVIHVCASYQLFLDTFGILILGCSL